MSAREKFKQVKIPVEHFNFARSRTEGLLGQVEFYYQHSRYIAPGDALGDILACAYLQGCNDTTQAIANNPALIEARSAT
jgi:hypothetical protein